MKAKTAEWNENVTYKVVKRENEYIVEEYLGGVWENQYDDNWDHTEAIYQMKRMSQGFEPDLDINI